MDASPYPFWLRKAYWWVGVCIHACTSKYKIQHDIPIHLHIHVHIHTYIYIYVHMFIWFYKYNDTRRQVDANTALNILWIYIGSIHQSLETAMIEKHVMIPSYVSCCTIPFLDCRIYYMIDASCQLQCPGFTQRPSSGCDCAMRCGPGGFPLRLNMFVCFT